MKTETARKTLLTGYFQRVTKLVLVLASATALVIVLGTTMHNVPSVRASAASAGCSDITLTGNYAAIQPAGFSSSGPTTGNEVPWQVVGVFHFDGSGNFSADYTAVVNGVTFLNQSGSGHYSVTSSGRYSECVGTLIMETGSAAGYTANLAVVGGGAEVFGLATGTGGTASFVAKKQ